MNLFYHKGQQKNETILCIKMHHMTCLKENEDPIVTLEQRVHHSTEGAFEATPFTVCLHWNLLQTVGMLR